MAIAADHENILFYIDVYTSWLSLIWDETESYKWNRC